MELPEAPSMIISFIPLIGMMIGISIIGYITMSDSNISRNHWKVFLSVGIGVLLITVFLTVLISFDTSYYDEVNEIINNASCDDLRLILNELPNKRDRIIDQILIRCIGDLK